MSTFDDPRFAPILQDRQFAPTMDYYIPQWEERTRGGRRRPPRPQELTQGDTTA